MAEYDPRPLSLGGQLDRAFSIYRDRFGVLLLSTFIGMMIPLVMMANSRKRFADLAMSLQSGARPEQLTAAIMAMTGKLATIALVSLIGVALIRGALAWVSHKALLGDRVDSFEALERGFRFLLPMLGLALVEGVIYLVAALVLYVPALILLFGGMRAGGGGLGAFFFVMLAIIVVMIYLVTGFFVTGPVLVCESDATVFKSLGRSWSLTKGGRWPIVGGVLAVAVTAFIAQVLLAIIFGVVTAARARGGALTDPGPVTLASFGLNCLVSLLVTSFLYVFQMVTYYDLRIRKEGLDLELTAERQTPK